MTTARPPYDPEIAATLSVQRPTPRILDLRDVGEVRSALAAGRPDIGDVIAGRDIDLAEHRIPTADGHRIALAVLRPRSARHPVPCVYYLHGGGMMTGSRYSEAEWFPGWIERFGVAVAAVEYRLAPEHPHPAPVEDCYAGLCWIAGHAAALGIDAGRILVAGVSAGGGLAAAVALLARDRGGPGLVGQLLMCPMLDDRGETLSTRQFESGPWNRAQNLMAWTALLGADRGGPDVSPYAAPARAADLSGLPPAFIDVGSAELLRDEDVAYARAIWAAGGQAELHVWAGGSHGFDLFTHTALAQAAERARDDWLARIFGVSMDDAARSGARRTPS